MGCNSRGKKGEIAQKEEEVEENPLRRGLSKSIFAAPSFFRSSGAHSEIPFPRQSRALLRFPVSEKGERATLIRARSEADLARGGRRKKTKEMR